jgi:adenylate cyclase
MIPPATPVEQRTLRRIGAPPNVRLACQLRPTTDLSIQPLVRTAEISSAHTDRFNAAVEGGRELTIAAMFVDMRDSTRLAAGRLPYDALFLFDRYIETVTGAIRSNGGHVTSVAGDGVMGVFGIEGSAADAARGALRAALDVWSGLEILNTELAAELPTPLRIGIGIHVGVSVIDLSSITDSRTLQFLGDSGNIAAKLEGRTKYYNCTVVASVSVLDLIAPDAPDIETDAVMIDGLAEPVRSAILRSKSELMRVLDASAAA